MMFDSKEAKAACDVIGQEYHKILLRDCEQIKADILDGSIEDDDALEERIHEEAENACIYTWDATLIAAWSDNSGAYEDEMGEKPPTVEAQACWAYMADLRDVLRAHDVTSVRDVLAAKEEEETVEA